MVEASPPPEADEQRCDYCRMPCPCERHTTETGGMTYTFCSNACKAAMDEREQVFTQYHGFMRMRPGVAGLDRGLPQGLPRNAFVLISGQAGTRDGAVHAEIVWRALKRGEPATIVTFQEPPSSVVQDFLTLDWNVIPYLEDDRLTIVDCFTYRVDDHQRMIERLNDWNRYLHSITQTATVTVRDPTDLTEVTNKLDNCLERVGMSDRGLVMIDSLTEVGTLVQPIQAYDFLKNLRADICKGRFVPIFAGATYDHDVEQFPHDLEYTADGIVDLQLNGDLVEDTLIKRVRIRKMAGVLAISEWRAYEYTAEKGMVVFDPAAEIAKAERRRTEAAADGEVAVDTDPDETPPDEAQPDETDTEEAPADDSPPGETDTDDSPDGTGPQADG
jgi:KaiC/GvpD/RAD55 family RecA-like ATPase/YHS domain-containing protein